MQLLDDALFNLWQDGICEEKDVVMKSNNPGELTARIHRAKTRVSDDDMDDDDFDDEDEYED